MKIEERYHYELYKDNSDVFLGVLSLGASLALDVDTTVWICTFKDRITGLEVKEYNNEKQIAFDKAYMGIKVAVMNFEIEEAYQKKQQELEERRLREEKRKQLEYEKELKRQNGETDEGSEAIVKIVVYGALIIGAIWLLFNIAIPFVILNAAIICLVYAFFNKEKGNNFLIISSLAAIYFIIDYKIGWLSKTLTTNAHFFIKIIPIIFYLNILSGIFSIILFTIFYFDDEKENNVINFKNISDKSNKIYLKIKNKNVETSKMTNEIVNEIDNVEFDSNINVDNTLSTQIENNYNDNIFTEKKQQCNKCNYSCNIDDKFCENCGNFLIKNTKQEPLNITCIQCNNEVNQDDNFCENCGNKLK